MSWQVDGVNMEKAVSEASWQSDIIVPHAEGLVAADAGILPGIPHWLAPDIDGLRLLPGRNTYRATVDDVPFDVFLDRKGRRRLIVLLPGATSRAKGHIDFQRHAWSRDFPEHDVLSVSDPSVRADNDLKLGWFQHEEKRYGLPALASLIRCVSERGNYSPEEIVLFGSSGGGFAALQLSRFLPDATAIAINPQINLANYFRSFYDKMITSCYPGRSAASVASDYPDRISVDIELDRRRAPVYIFQNVHDHLHLNKHLRPFVGTFDEGEVASFQGALDAAAATRKLNVIYYDDEASGHSPPSKEQTLAMIEPIVMAGPPAGRAQK